MKTTELISLSKKELLKRAEDYLFSAGLNDGASSLCKQNVRYGLAQFQYIQEKYGFEPKASFITSPDETISKNKFRWRSGIGYGGRLNWGKGSDKLIFLNVKPNCCGILVGGLYKKPDPREIIRMIYDTQELELYEQEVLMDWDYGISNHFINCYETKNLSELDLPPYLFMVHGSAPEFRDDSNGLGLYIDHSSVLKDMAIQEETPFGTQYILLDSNAKQYLQFHHKVLRFSSKKREILADIIFDQDFELICNQPHQFLKDFNNMFLGCNCTDTECSIIKSNIFPIALKADIAAYLFRGKKNFSETILKNLGYLERAERLGVMDLLLNADILPHGGGYFLEDIKSVEKVIEIENHRYFVCNSIKNKKRKKIIEHLGSVPFSYRGRDVVLKTLQLDLGDIIARMNPLFSIKL